MTTVDSATGFYVCPMFNDPCRHCSVHITIHPFTKIRPSDKGRYYDSAGLGKRTEIVGEFCNNDGTRLVQDLQYCPSRWGLHRPVMGTLTAPIGRLAGAVVVRAKKAAKVGKTRKKPEKKPYKRTSPKKKYNGKRLVKPKSRVKVKRGGKQAPKKQVGKPKARKV
jgi:hypothetical protein